jgi:hypothetical protein
MIAQGNALGNRPKTLFSLSSSNEERAGVRIESIMEG